MTKEDFITLYRTWTGTKLLASYKNRKDFQPIAVEAMFIVLKEKKLDAAAEQILAEDKANEEMRMETEKHNLQMQQENYEVNFLGVNTDATTYAKSERGKSATYASADLSSAKGIGWRILLTSSGTVCLILFFLLLKINPFGYYAIVSFGGIGVLSLTLAIYMKRNSKAAFRLYENAGKKIVFEVTHADFVFVATVPFTYFVRYGESVTRSHGITVKNPILYLIITNNSGEKVALMEYLTALQSPPPTWPRIHNATDLKDARVFGQALFHKLGLVRLKKILDGLHTSS